MRKIPATMATQHPDNAAAPYWDKAGRPFVGAHQEINEAVACFSEMGSSEYMWDWEGKNADAAVIDRLFSEHYDYFKRHLLGRDKFLTFRIPNIWEEKGYNLLQAMSVILSSEDFAHDLKFKQRPLFEVILPMTERAGQLMHMSKLFERLSRFKSNDFTTDRRANSDYLEMIPLIESVESQLAVADLLEDYIKQHKRHFGRQPEYIRPFLACSDSALSSGFLPALLGNKLGLARLYEFADKMAVPVFPIAGSGGLPFRGGLTPKTVGRLTAELPGIRTVTVQSSFRYDHPLTAVKAAIKQLEADLPTTKPLSIDPARQLKLESVIKKATGHYRRSIQGLAKEMQPVFKAVPKRRDRRQHIGLVAYSRSMGGQTLPRAITFTGAFYSIGVPPEFIGFGRALSQLKPDELETLKDAYKSLPRDMAAAGRFLNRHNLDVLAARNAAWKEVSQDVKLVESVLGQKFEPTTKNEVSHQKLSAAALTLRDETDLLRDLIDKMALLRGSLG